MINASCKYFNNDLRTTYASALQKNIITNIVINNHG